MTYITKNKIVCQRCGCLNRGKYLYHNIFTGEVVCEDCYQKQKEDKIMKAILTYNGNRTKPKIVARGIDESVWPYPDHETSAYYAEKLRGRYAGFLVEIETKNVLYSHASADHVAKIGKVTELAGIECIPFDLDKATQFAWQAFIQLECKKLSERTGKPVSTANQNGDDFPEIQITAEQLREMQFDVINLLHQTAVNGMTTLPMFGTAEKFSKSVGEESVMDSVLPLKQKEHLNQLDLYIDKSKIPVIDLKLDSEIKLPKGNAIGFGKILSQTTRDKIRENIRETITKHEENEMNSKIVSKTLSQTIDDDYKLAKSLSEDLAENYVATNLQEMMIEDYKIIARNIRKCSEEDINSGHSTVQDYRKYQRCIYDAVYSLLEGYKGYKITRDRE